MKYLLSALAALTVAFSHNLAAAEPLTQSQAFYSHDYEYTGRTVHVRLECEIPERKWCDVEATAKSAVKGELYLRGALAQEINAIEDAMHYMIDMGIVLSRFTVSMRVDDKDVHDKLAVAAIRSKEWRRAMAFLQTPEVQPDVNAHELFGELLFSSGAFNPLNTMLANHGMKITSIDGVEQYMTEKFYKLHLQAPGVDSKDKTRVPTFAAFVIHIARK